MKNPVRLQAGPDTVPVSLVGRDEKNRPPRWFDFRVLRTLTYGPDAKVKYDLVGQTFRATLRKNGQYVLAGTFRDRGSYLLPEDLGGYLNA